MRIQSLKVSSRFFGVRKAELLPSLFRAAASVYVLHILSVALRFATSVFLARALSVSDYGAYAYVVTWLAVLTVPGALGTHRLLVRELSVWKNENRQADARGLLQFSVVCAMGIPGLLLFGGTLFVGFQYVLSGTNAFDSTEFSIFFLAILTLPFFTLSYTFANALNGFNLVILSQIGELFLKPSFFLISVVIVYFITAGTAGIFLYLMFQLIVASVILVVYAIMLYTNLPAEIRASPARYNLKYWFGSMAPFFLIGTVEIVNTRANALILGILKGTTDVAYYSVPFMVSQLIVFVLFAVDTAISPTFSKLFDADNKVEIQRVAVKTARFMAAISFPILIVAVLLGHTLLSIFGSAYPKTYPILIILLIGKYINILSGSNSQLLMMTKNETGMARIILSAATINIILSFILIPLLGAEGAAIANVFSLILWNGLATWMAKKKLGINTTVFGRYQRT